MIPFRVAAVITDSLKSQSLSASTIKVNNRARLPIKTNKQVINESEPVVFCFQIS